jgi:lysozyme
MKYLKTYDELNEKIRIKSLLDKFKFNPNKQIAKIIITSLLAIYSFSEVKNILNKQDLPKPQLLMLNNQLNSVQVQKETHFNPLDLKLSQEGWDEIREEEKLRLTAYKIGDGKVTVGWGHAQPINTSKYKVGQKITKEEAQKLLVQDVNDAANSLRRIFKQWEDQGINIKITQNQFDVMVSMIFNMGIGNFRKSDFIQTVKNNDLEKAAELIKTTNVSKKFPGLKDRRKREYDKFVS